MFFIPDDWRDRACPCCAKKTLLLIADSALSELRPGHAGEAVKEDGGESGGEDYLSEELAIAAFLNAAWIDAGRRGADPFFELLEEPRSLSVSALDEAAERARPAMTDLLSGERSIIRDEVDRAVFKGGRFVNLLDRAGGESDILAKARLRPFIREKLTDSIEFYVNRYFDREIAPRIKRIAGELLDGLGALEKPTNEAVIRLRDRIAALFGEEQPYMRLVSGVAANRGYNWGVLKAADIRGYLQYQFVAVIDERTTDICRYMNGRVFTVWDGLNLLEQAARAEGDDVKSAHPWPKFEDIDGKSTAQLRDMGVIAPPLHGHCRSVVVPI